MIKLFEDHFKDVYLYGDKFEECLSLLAALLEFDPSNPQWNRWYGCFAELIGQNPILYYECCIACAPNYWVDDSRYAMAEYISENWGNIPCSIFLAANMYEMCLREGKRKDNPSVMLYLANIYWDEKHFHRAFATSMKIIQLPLPVDLEEFWVNPWHEAHYMAAEYYRDIMFDTYQNTYHFKQCLSIDGYHRQRFQFDAFVALAIIYDEGN